MLGQHATALGAPEYFNNDNFTFHALSPSMRAHARSYISRALSLSVSTDNVGRGLK